MTPVVALAGTVALIVTVEGTLKLAGAPLKVTLDAARKPVPVIVTDAPSPAVAGEYDVITGTGEG